jgi:signal peptidase II
MSMRAARSALALAFTVLLVDCTTKRMAVENLSPDQVPHQVVGDVVRFTLAYNPGAAMSLPVGANARWPLTIVGIILLVVLLRLLWKTPPGATARRVALGLILGGALGNITSRIFERRGVVDFIDVGVGGLRFYVFNVADIGVFIGACLLAISIWREERQERVPPLVHTDP